MVNDKKSYLLDKLKISDFILRGEYGEYVLDWIVEYNRQASVQTSGISGAKDKIKAETGLDIKALKTLLDLPEEDLEKLFTGNSQLVESIPDEELPEEYKNLKSKIAKARVVLESDKTLPKDKRKELEEAVSEGEAELQNLKVKLVEERLRSDTAALSRNPKMLKAMLSILDSEAPEVKIDQRSENLKKIRKEIETNFLIMKGFDTDVVEKITKGTHELALSRKEFTDLLMAIVENDDLLNQKQLLFTNTLS